MPSAVHASNCFLFFSHLFLIITPSVGRMGVGFPHFTEDETGTERLNCMPKITQLGHDSDSFELQSVQSWLEMGFP